MAGILASDYLEYASVSCRLSYLIYMLSQCEGFTMRDDSWPDDLGYDLWYCLNCNVSPPHVLFLNVVECAECGAKVLNYQKAMALKYPELSDGLPWRWAYCEEYYKYVRLHRQCASPLWRPPHTPTYDVISVSSDDEECTDMAPGEGTVEDPVDLTLDD